MHFSDPKDAPSYANNQVVQHTDNRDLMRSDERFVLAGTQEQLLLLLAVLVTSALLIAILHTLLASLRHGVEWLFNREPRPRDDDEQRAGSLPVVEFRNDTRNDPYSLLGISAKASDYNVRSAYEKAMARYSADQLLGMSPGQQEAARIRATEIEQAWQQIRAERHMG